CSVAHGTVPTTRISPTMRKSKTSSAAPAPGPAEPANSADAMPKSKTNAAAPAPAAVVSPTEETANGQAAVDSSKLRSIPDFDLYLFNMGEHRRAHRFLGAHLVDGGIRFTVWAPNAQRVSVVGSFNNWNIHAHAMERRGSTGVWERFIPDLGHGFTYKFAV